MSSITKAMMMSENSNNNFSNIPLTFEALEENTIISIQNYGSPIVSGLQYRIGENNNWNDYIIGTEITLLNIGDIVQFQNISPTLSTSSSNYVYFTITKLVDSFGNIQSLLNYSRSTNNFCFYRLFNNCNTLKTAPELPATTLASRCYYNMFNGCTSLTQAPVLPATTLADSCYQSMFNGCTSLTQAPVLPATRLTNYCYRYMFRYCNTLSNITVYFNDWNSSMHSTDNWLTSVKNNGTFICSRSLSGERGDSFIPTNWTIEYFD